MGRILLRKDSNETGRVRFLSHLLDDRGAIAISFLLRIPLARKEKRSAQASAVAGNANSENKAL